MWLGLERQHWLQPCPNLNHNITLTLALGVRMRVSPIPNPNPKPKPKPRANPKRQRQGTYPSTSESTEAVPYLDHDPKHTWTPTINPNTTIKPPAILAHLWFPCLSNLNYIYPRLRQCTHKPRPIAMSALTGSTSALLAPSLLFLEGHFGCATRGTPQAAFDYEDNGLMQEPNPEGAARHAGLGGACRSLIVRAHAGIMLGYYSVKGPCYCG